MVARAIRLTKAYSFNFATGTQTNCCNDLPLLKQQKQNQKASRQKENKAYYISVMSKQIIC